MFFFLNSFYVFTLELTYICALFYSGILPQAVSSFLRKVDCQELGLLNCSRKLSLALIVHGIDFGLQIFVSIVTSEEDITEVTLRSHTVKIFPHVIHFLFS